MKWGRMFIGKHLERNRPVNPVDEQLMRRLAEARQRLMARNVEPVAVLQIKNKNAPAHLYR